MTTPKKDKASALNEKEGIKAPEIMSSVSANAIKSKRQKTPSVNDLVSGILEGNVTSLSRAITLIESTNPEHTKKANSIITQCLPHANKSVRVGITGVPGVGDELQGIKRGIIEMADAIVINKADGDNIKRAKAAKVEFNRALHLYPEKASGWAPKTKTCSALKNEGISEIWDMIGDYISDAKSSNYFETHRTEQNKFWLLQTIEDRLKSDFFNRKDIKSELQKQIDLIEAGKTTPFSAAEYLLGL